MPTPSLLRRIAALVYDLFLLIALLFGWVALSIGANVWLVGEEAVKESTLAAPQWSVQLGILVVISGFYSFFWRKQGQTLGMQAWRIKTQQPNGELLTQAQCFKRIAAGALSWACFGLGYLWALGPSKQTWHDKLSGTEVVLLPKESRKKD